jgi:DNA helicase-2/ATP-dependent DNA helicase PcrA
LSQVISDTVASNAFNPTTAAPPLPSTSQRAAIEAEPGPLLVLAGPGAGKTYCLIERIRFLVEKKGIDPARICAFTFTNKAAGEISHRLERFLGERAEQIKRGTIHSFCVELLREFGDNIALEPGFGIADEEYQLQVLRRIGVAPKWQRNALKAFTSHRFINGYEIDERDHTRFVAYQAFLAKRNLLDFDMLVLKTAELLRSQSAAAQIQDRWDAVLVDEFQDLNPVQYSIVKALAMSHRNIFAVGDDEQSIYSWAGADPEVFTELINNFNAKRTQLRENRRCPKGIVALARSLVTINTPIFTDERFSDTTRESQYPVQALAFANEDDELSWIIDDMRRDRELNHLAWGDIALLYRTHEIGYAAEAAFLTAGVPCRLAHGRALADDPVVGYLIAALRVISNPKDPIHKENFLRVVLPRPLFDSARAKAEEKRRPLLQYLEKMARGLAREHGDRQKIWRGLYALRNLQALGARHTRCSDLVDELLSQRVGEYRTMLEENHDELSDPAENDEVQVLAGRIAAAAEVGLPVWIPRLGGIEIALKGMLVACGINRVELGGIPSDGAASIGPSDCTSLGIGLGLFKALQLIRSTSFTNHFRDFTALDIETTDKDITRAEVVEIAAVKVRDGVVVDEYSSFVRPRVPITVGARAAHNILDSDVDTAPYFEEIWPMVRAFCGSDVVVAHNGYQFDFPVLRRMAGKTDDAPLVTYDTLLLARELHPGSRKLEDLARVYGIDKGQSHRALDDTKTLAQLFLHLGDAKVVRARKTSLDNILDHLGIALALSDREELCKEAETLRERARYFALSRYSNCLDLYRAEVDKSGDASITTADKLIELLGGEGLMTRLRTDKTAEQRYPSAMLRIRPLLDLFRGKPLAEQLTGFLERVALSKMDGEEPESARVNLLTLHSTKGLEFSRVYIVGVEDTAMPGRTQKKEPAKKEIEESRRLLYVGMTRTIDRLVLTRVDERTGKPTGANQFLDEMGLAATRVS